MCWVGIEAIQVVGPKQVVRTHRSQKDEMCSATPSIALTGLAVYCVHLYHF